MDVHGVVTVIACAGHLACGALAFSRRSKSPLAAVLALLFLDAFTWNFAGLAHELSGGAVWNRLDHLASSLMPAIALHAIVVFVGRWRGLRAVVFGLYASFAGLGLFVHHGWWKVLVVAGPAAMLGAVVLLGVHRTRSTDPAERARTDLILVALCIGTLLSVTDLMHVQFPDALPRLGAIGTLVATVLFAVAALRLDLLGREVPPIVGLYVLLLALFWIFVHLTVTRWVDSQSGPWILGAAALVLVGLASAREVGRSAALRRARTEQLATLGRFAMQLAHDVKNPLAALKGALQFLEQERSAGRPLDAQAKLLPLMLEQVERVARIADDYQRIAKVEPRVATTSLNALVEDTLPLQRFGVTPGIAIETELAANLPACPLDRDLVITALENVLRNACEAMPGGGAIVVRTTHDAAHDRVVVDVADQGPGMDARELDQATKPFFTTKATGTGLGLAFADRVARAHGGALDLTSKLGRGTTVTMAFPIHPLGAT